MSLQPSWFAGILYDMRVGQLYRHESKVADWIEYVNWTPAAQILALANSDEKKCEVLRPNGFRFPHDCSKSAP